MVVILSSSHPLVSFSPSGWKKLTRSNGKDWIKLRENAWVTSKVEGPLSAAESNGFWGRV